jgi:hypothetical protein
MTRLGPRKNVDEAYWRSRRIQAREFHDSARSLVTLEDSKKTYNPAIALMINCVIAYGDCVTAKAKGVINQVDHSSALGLLRDALRRNLPDRQEKIFRQMLGRKDEVNYGVKITSLSEAQKLLAELDEFVSWAEGVL